MNKVWTISSILKRTRQLLKAQNIESAHFEAQVLLAHVLGLTRIELFTQSERPLDAQELSQYRTIIIERVRKRVPLAYLTGKKGFWNFDFDVSPSVLIPRADTECLVEEALRYLKSLELPVQTGSKNLDQPREAAETPHFEALDVRAAYYAELLAREAQAEALVTGDVVETESEAENDDVAGAQVSQADVDEAVLRIVDVGTGSGVIALALASELPSTTREIWAMDISEAALEVAKENAAKLGLNENLHFLKGDLLASFCGQADLIVSNPPYVSTGEYADLEPELYHEPELALAAGRDGLDIYRRLVVEAREKLKLGGALIVEIGHTQGQAVQALFADAGFSELKLVQDYGHLDRVVSGRLL